MTPSDCLALIIKRRVKTACKYFYGDRLIPTVNRVKQSVRTSVMQWPPGVDVR